MQRLEPIYRFQINNENAEGFSYWLEQHQLFTRAAAAGFFQNKLPREMGSHIGTWLNRQDAGRLVVASQSAHQWLCQKH